jgi:hypothetical protein
MLSNMEVGLSLSASENVYVNVTWHSKKKCLCECYMTFKKNCICECFMLSNMGVGLNLSASENVYVNVT